MKKEYGFYTRLMSEEQWKEFYNRIKDDFEVNINKNTVRLSLTDEELVLFTLKYGHVAATYLITSYIFDYNTK